MQLPVANFKIFDLGKPSKTDSLIMREIPKLIENNRNWASELAAEDPKFFNELAKAQSPEYLWIGCADSRVPANQVVGLMPGEVFVHRNIANVVVHTDFNCLSVIEYAVAVLKVKHVIVCGHYGCGGVKAASENHQYGLIDNWLRHIRDVKSKHEAQLKEISDDNQRFNRLCELNVIEQALNVCHTTIIQEAWANAQQLSVHGWIYNIQDGLINDLNVTIEGPDEIEEDYKIAVTGGNMA